MKMGENEALEIKGLHVSVEGVEILKGVDLTVRKGEIHAVMGPNGSGKSTLAYALMGHPKYDVTQGEVQFKGQNLLELEPEERSKLGLFLAFQYPFEIEGVPLARFLMTAYQAHRNRDQNQDQDQDVKSPSPNGRRSARPLGEFRKLLLEKLEVLKMDESFAKRYLNEGFSGGEKKRAEILQMLVLQPEIAILDETDSGLDIDSVKVVAEAVNTLRGPGFGALVITHYQRILNYLEPDFVHVMVDGAIVASGGGELAHELERKGYDWIIALARGQKRGSRLR